MFSIMMFEIGRNLCQPQQLPTEGTDGSFPHTWQGVLWPPEQDGIVCTVVQQLWLGNLVFGNGVIIYIL